MEECGFTVAIIGMGIIGGSMGYALRGFRSGVVVGCDISPETRQKVLVRGAADKVCKNARDAIEGADLVVLCVYPELIPQIIRENREHFKLGAVITDVCGVKESISGEITDILPETCEFVGGHPMAGKETDGFDSASPELFGMCGYIITPTPKSTERGISLVREMAEYIGATYITLSTPKEHDKVIAYTSDLMHFSAAALCLDYNEKMNRAYTAGAFRDCTRIANINPQLWSGLFLKNRENLLDEIKRLSRSLEKLKNAVEESDRDELERLLEQVRKNKLEMQEKFPE